MKNPTNPTPTPRRSPNLEPEKVLLAASHLLDEVGFAGLTLRRLADKLGVKAAALYWHFNNKQDLVDQLAAAIVDDEFQKVKPDMDKADWRGVLLLTGTGLREALQRYRDGALTIASSDLTQTKAMDSQRYIVTRLQAEGFTPELAARALFCVTRYTLGCVLEEQVEARHPEGRVSFEEGIELLLTGLAMAHNASPEQ